MLQFGSPEVQIFRGAVFPCPQILTSTFLGGNPKIILTGMSLTFCSLGSLLTALVSTVLCLRCRITRGFVNFQKPLISTYRRKYHHAVVGAFVTNPFPIPCNLSPLNSIPKRDSTECRIIVDSSFLKGNSVNATIPKTSYLVHLTFPTMDALKAMVKHKGQGCALYKCDLPWAYCQIPVDPGDIHHLGYK